MYMYRVCAQYVKDCISLQYVMRAFPAHHILNRYTELNCHDVIFSDLQLNVKLDKNLVIRASHIEEIYRSYLARITYEDRIL